MNDYGLQAANQKIGYDAQVCAPGELNRLSQRLEGILACVKAITNDLAGHADRLHGGNAMGAAGEQKPRPVRSGAFGMLEDLIDMTDEQLGALQQAASRNTSLA